jgi:cysteine desulfurase
MATHQAMTIYLDYQATTPTAHELIEAMRPWLGEKFANPHSTHAPGREAKAAVEVAREQILALLPSGGKLYFTSGATEAINWAIKGSVKPGGGILVPDTEHAAVRDTALYLAERGSPLHLAPVRPDGLVDPAAFAASVKPGIALIGAMLVNNEIGAIQPIDALAEVARDWGVPFLCDAVQGFGRMPMPEGVDMIAISAHKIHGPKGVGALWVRDGIALEPLLHGGGQEGGLRSGTLSPALCAGFGAAAALAAKRMEADADHVERLWDQALEMLPADWSINGSTSERYKGNLNLRRAGLDASRLISEVRSVAFSAGSACASGSGRPSHVLKALGLSDADLKSSIRIGFGRYTSADELAAGLSAIFKAAREQ